MIALSLYHFTTFCALQTKLSFTPAVISSVVVFLVLALVSFLAISRLLTFTFDDACVLYVQSICGRRSVCVCVNNKSAKFD